LPSPAIDGGRDGGIEFEGEVCSGLGEGARFVALDWAASEFRRTLGYEPWPGTLNLRMAGAAWARWRQGLTVNDGIAIAPPPGFCAARCFVVQLDGRVRAAAVVPDVGDYPPDKLELVAPVALRDALQLRDGSMVSVRVVA
jgi:CTP-dependent riboflavin kinase